MCSRALTCWLQACSCSARTRRQGSKNPQWACAASVAPGATGSAGACKHVSTSWAVTPNAMCLEHPLHVLRTQQYGVGGGGGQIDEVPQPGLISSRAQLEHLGIKPVQLIAQLIGTTTERFEQRFFRTTKLS